MPIQLSLPPTSISSYSQFVNAAFINRRRGVCSSVVRIGLKKKSNGKDDYSVATFQKLYDFTGEELASIRAYADSFKQQVKAMLEQRAADLAENAVDMEIVQPSKAMPDNGEHFDIGAFDGDISDLPA